jgi:hypothetical protein
VKEAKLDKPVDKPREKSTERKETAEKKLSANAKAILEDLKSDESGLIVFVLMCNGI